jgi:hypothetical protein
MVEIWLLFSLMQPFLDVLLQTYVNFLNDQMGKKQLGLSRQLGLKKSSVSW